MYANPGTKWACPIKIPCHNQLTIQTLTVTLSAITLIVTQSNKGKKIQIKVHAGNSNKAIEKKKKFKSTRKKK